MISILPGAIVIRELTLVMNDAVLPMVNSSFISLLDEMEGRNWSGSNKTISDRLFTPEVDWETNVIGCGYE